MKNNVKNASSSLNLINYRLKTLKREIEKKRSPSYLVDEVVNSNEKIKSELNKIANSDEDTKEIVDVLKRLNLL